MPQQPARSGIRAAEALGLTVFLATAAFLTVLFATWLAKGPDDFPQVALLFSTACALVAAFGMLWDAIDLWLRGRRMAPQSVRNLRMMVLVAVFGALATSVLGQNTVLVLYLAPALLTYLFITRRRRPVSRTQAAGGGSSGARSASGSGDPYKGRQRRGGRKRR